MELEPMSKPTRAFCFEPPNMSKPLRNPSLAGSYRLCCAIRSNARLGLTWDLSRHHTRTCHDPDPGCEYQCSQFPGSNFASATIQAAGPTLSLRSISPAVPLRFPKEGPYSPGNTLRPSESLLQNGRRVLRI